MGTCINAWMGLHFGHIPPLTTELAALERLKIDVTTFSRLLLILFKLAGNEDMRMSSNFSHTGPPTTELAALECRKIPIKL